MSTATRIAAELVEDFVFPNCNLRVLLIEDNADDCEIILHALQRNGFELTHEVVESASDFRNAVNRFAPQIILADYNLPQWRGMEAIDILREEGLDIPLIVVSGSLGDVTAVECIKCGASDYVLKDSLSRLSISVRRALGEKKSRELRKQTERELAVKVQQLAQSNAELEQFAYVASHDLQEPLRMVAAYTQLLAERYADKLDPTAQKYIRYAVDGSVRMQGLIHDLLSFSRCGRTDSNLDPVDFNAIVSFAVTNLSAAQQESGASVTYRDLPTIAADGSRMKQVFQNLIGNAIKFRGPLLPVITISAEKKEECWEFEIRDNGIGIDPQHREGVFEIFRRLHTREEYQGNGIGLSICKKIVEQHGGRIWAESHDGQGSIFKFTIPSKTAGEVTPTTQSEGKR